MTSSVEWYATIEGGRRDMLVAARSADDGTYQTKEPTDPLRLAMYKAVLDSSPDSEYDDDSDDDRVRVHVPIRHMADAAAVERILATPGRNAKGELMPEWSRPGRLRGIQAAIKLGENGSVSAGIDWEWSWVRDSLTAGRPLSSDEERDIRSVIDKIAKLEDLIRRSNKDRDAKEAPAGAYTDEEKERGA